MITPVCQTFGKTLKVKDCRPVFWCFSKFSRHLIHSRQPMYSYSVHTFNILSQISSSPAAFQDFNPRMAAVTFVNVKTFSFTKSIVLHASVCVSFTGFNKYSKYCILSNVKRFPSRPRGCSQLNP